MDDVRLARHALLHPRPHALDVARFVLRIHFGAVDVSRPSANRTRKQSDTERANDRVAVVVEGVSRWVCPSLGTAQWTRRLWRPS
jgi:hypothetical protein|eukprot:COSAG02_NODE_8811_length_2436_cov_1.494651_3_plen_85_part_00